MFGIYTDYFYVYHKNRMINKQQYRLQTILTSAALEIVK